MSLDGETPISRPCLHKRGCLRRGLPARLGFWGLAHIRQAILDQSRRRDYYLGVLLAHDRLFEASLAGKTGIFGGCL